MSGFIDIAGVGVTNIAAFLREASSGNSIKYKATARAKNHIYIPFLDTEVLDSDGKSITTKQIVAKCANIHSWTDTNGRYKATVCLKGVVRNDAQGNLINNGNCPICDSVGKAWDIWRYRLELEGKNYKGDESKRDQYLKDKSSEFSGERKAQEPRAYLYMLIAQFRKDSRDNFILGDNGVPEFDLKVMKLGQTIAGKLCQVANNSGLPLEGGEFIFQYPDTEDVRLLQPSIAPLFGAKTVKEQYPQIEEVIKEEAKKFSWEGIEKSFQEWEGMTLAQAKAEMDEAFKDWDEYEKRKAVDPNALYIEGSKSVDKIAISSSSSDKDTVPGIPGVPNSAGMNTGIPDVNALFGGVTTPDTNISDINI